MSNIKIAKQLPFKILVKRVLKRLFPAKTIQYSNHEFRACTSEFTINSILNSSNFIATTNTKTITHYLNHEFDLLGSGWVSRNLSGKPSIQSNHKDFTSKIVKHITSTYQLIDWQKDIKSGFVFKSDLQFDAQRIDKTKNVDIKNCWELGRLQHLPQLAIAAISASNKEELILEFKNQSLDFIGSNPIGMGVQWACAMDVAIRISNWLVAYDIFKQSDLSNLLDETFTAIFLDAIYQHTLFVFNHLEHKEGAAGNHYLFNLAGILFATTYLSSNKETLKWQQHAENEIVNEFEKQFFNDGGNFEGSTTYHCLSAEAILYTTALMLRSGKSFNQNYINLLGKVYQFIEAVIKPNNEMPQFGDNDSGRFFKFDTNQNLLNYKNILNAFSGLYKAKNGHCLEHQIIEQIALKNKLVHPLLKEAKEKYQIRNAKHQLQKPKTTVIKFAESIDTDKIDLFSFNEFGIYIYKSEEFYLAISAISNKNMHHSWGHVHNDKLSFELQVKGEDVVKDPGTYTYSAFPEKRNLLRSTKAHHGILVDKFEQNKAFGLVYLEREITCKVLEIKDLTITLQANYYGVEHTRKFTIQSNQLIITDYCNKPFSVNINQFNEYAPNYGTLNKIKR
ncbi:MAG: alginate lyase family protein [Vicingaceae bacterium]